MQTLERNDATELKKTSTDSENGLKGSKVSIKIPQIITPCSQFGSEKNCCHSGDKTPTMEKAQSVSLLPSVPSLSLECAAAFISACQQGI